MARTIFLFYTVCRDPRREQELGEWYDEIHIPDVESVPGFTSCSRYRLTDAQLFDGPGGEEIEASYLSIVDADLDVETARPRLEEAIADWRERGRMTDLFEIVSSRIVTEVNPSPGSA